MHPSDVLVTLVMAVSLLAIVLCTRYAIRWRGRWRAAALVPLVLLVAWLIAVLLRWPSEHTLWPLELILYGPAALAYILIVRWRVNILERQRQRASLTGVRSLSAEGVALPNQRMQLVEGTFLSAARRP
jgi:hypothetical protein